MELLRILMADDSHADVLWLNLTLESLKRPYALTVVCDGQTALSRILKESDAFNLILLDMGLPKLDAEEILSRVPKLALSAHLPHGR